nr:MAG TPA: hypothetical protein [Caudoviricetes sp.]
MSSLFGKSVDKFFSTKLHTSNCNVCSTFYVIQNLWISC